MINFEIYENSRENSARLFSCPDGRFIDWELYYGIYEYLFYTLEQPHEIAEDAASWCELHSVGDAYETDDFTITIWED